MGSFGIRAKYDVIRSRDSATFTGSYQTLGTALTNPGILVKIVNNSGVIITVSTDGTNDHDVLPSSSFVLYDYSANKQDGPTLCVPVGTQYYVKGAASTGLVYLVIQYTPES